MKLYWIELRRSPLRLWFPLLVGVDLAALFGRSTWWIGEWPQASVQAQIPAFYFAPLLAAAAAWAAGRVDRHNVHAQLDAAAHPRWRSELVQLSATLTYGLGAYAAGVIAAVIVTLPKAGPGFLWPSYIFLGVSLLITYAGIGHLIGHWLRSPFTGPLISGLGGLVLISWMGSPKRLGLFALSGDPFKEISQNALMARALMAMALVIAAVSLRRKSPLSVGRVWNLSAHRGRTLVVGVLLCGSILGLSMAGPVQVARSAPSQPLCTKGTPRICLWPEDRKYLPEAEGMVKRINRLPRRLFTIPSEFQERGLSGPGEPFSGFFILEGSMWNPAATMAGSIMHASWPKENGCTLPLGSRLTPQFRQASADLTAWLTVRIFGGGTPAGIHGGPPNVSMPAMAQLADKPEGEQMDWVKSRMQVVHNTFCS
ncbi:hypothetical protein J1792_08710 [Streptomyces triculaminicus]|uniref:Uncharacterized protein n=1 Tax=Streptomyces triculaminicus TaxID=2816232 RepID=A0A939FIZ7_9ACTN|nr:hypothetical protein [Streptomyces triculaminicus]MBO0652865.1 hypothetical protein [Streptomyces triculaminicus]